MIRRLRRLDRISLVAGLVVGLVVGVLANSGGSLLGTANKKPDKDVTYYLVELETVQAWLAEKFPETSEDVKAAVDVIARLPTSLDFSQDFQNAETYVQTVLPQMYGALTDADDIENIEEKSDSKVAVCLGMDDNPYEQNPQMYVYLTIPDDQVDDVGIPKDWEQLDKPKTNVLYWQLLACFPEPEK